MLNSAASKLREIHANCLEMMNSAASKLEEIKEDYSEMLNMVVSELVGPILPAETMGKVPRLYSGMGKSARDLLYMPSHSQRDPKFTISTHSITDFEIYIQLKHSMNITTDLCFDTNSELLTKITVAEPAYPGVKAIFTFKPRFAKVELQSLQDYYGLTSSMSLAPDPTLDFSAALRSNNLVVGSEVSFNAIEGGFTKYNIGASFTTSYLVASLALNDKFDTLSASYYHKACPFSRTAVGAEVEHSFSRNEDRITVGAQCAVDRLTTAMVRVNNFGKASVVMERELSPVSNISVSAGVDTRSIVESTKFGLVLALKERVKISHD